MMSAQSYSASIGWGPREETPEQLAARLIKAIESIRALGPIFSAPYTVSDDDKFLEPLELRMTHVAGRIASGVVHKDDGTPNPREGYMLTIFNTDQPKKAHHDFKLGIFAGASVTWSGNSAYFTTGDSGMADPSLVSFTLFKSILFIMGDAFEISFGTVFSSALADFWTRGRDAPRLKLKWMTYLGPRFAHFADPPPSAIVERRPNGGLFMAATDEVFSVEEPEHMAVAHDIQAACAPFNALKRPYPGLEWPEA